MSVCTCMCVYMHTCACVHVHSELIQPTAIGSIVVVTATKIPSPNLADSPSFPVISFCPCMYSECLCVFVCVGVCVCAFVCVCVCPYKPPLRIQCAELTERKETRKDGKCVRERGRGNRNKLQCWPIFSNPATRRFSGTDVPPIPVFLKPSAVKSSHNSPIAWTAAALIESHVRRASAGGVFICLCALLQACVGGSVLIYFSVQRSTSQIFISMCQSMDAVIHLSIICIFSSLQILNMMMQAPARAAASNLTVYQTQPALSFFVLLHIFMYFVLL